MHQRLINLFSTTILALTFLSLSQNVIATDDSYHASIRNQLQTEFGIVGGDWMFSDNETATMGSVLTYGGVQSQIVNIAGQPFSQAFRATSPTAMPFRWNRALYANATQPVSAGDTMLLVFWVRSLSAQAGNGILMAEYRNAEPPYEASLNKLIAPSQTWEQWFIPFEMQDSFAANQSTVALQIASQAQTIEFGGIALLNFGNSYSTEDLESVRTRIDEDYLGREPDAVWRESASQRIEQHRKSDLTINVVDKNGDPVANAVINVEMLKHAYQFGTAINSNTIVEDSADGDMYRRKILDLDGKGHGFNLGTTEGHLQWILWEQSTTNVMQNLQWMAVNDVAPRGHSVIWPRNNWPVPDDVRNNVSDTEYLAGRVESHIVEKLSAAGVNGQLGTWDFVNELAHESFFSDSFATLPQYQTGDEVFGEWLMLADATDTNAKWFYNEYELLNHGALAVGFHDRHKDLIHLLQSESGGRLNGIGMQAHVTPPFAGPNRVVQMLDEYAAEFPNLDIQITEFDCDITNDKLTAEYLRDFMTACFSHPQTTAFIMWGFWDGRHWLDNAPLFYADWTPKPAYHEYVNLVFDEWWTSEQVTSDFDGSASTRGFHGSYLISTTIAGQTIETEYELVQGQNELTVTLPLDAWSLVVPESLEVTQGNVLGGGISELTTSDNEYLNIRNNTGSIFVETTTTSPNLTPSQFYVRVEQKHVLESSSRAPVNVFQAVELFDYDSKTFVEVDHRVSRAFDRVTELLITDQPARFVEQKSGQMRMRLIYTRTGLVRGIRTLVDHIEWDIAN